jgi:predicted AlkP superfamily pyrophosphatase or phosphodiesterase
MKKKDVVDMTDSPEYPKKRIIMLMLDSLMDQPLKKAIETKDLPALKFFVEKGTYYPNIVTPFPTMSVNVESTLLSGTYSDTHHVPGLVWYKQNENRIINYGTHVMEMFKLGLTRSLHDVFYRLNNRHLNQQATTIHEELDRKGMTSASINTLVYRGNAEHQLTTPSLLRFFVPVVKHVKTKGAKSLTYGVLSRINPVNQHGQLWKKYGFNNNYSVQELTHLIRQNELPDFSIVYFPDHDKNVHKHGVMDDKGIIEMDQQLQDILNCYDSWDEALKDNIWVIIGDNGQSHIINDKNKASVHLKDMLSPYRVARLKHKLKKEDQIVLAVNLRSAFIYSLDTDKVPLKTIVRTFEKDNRIDVIAWKENGWINVSAGGKEGLFRFKREGDWIDEYNQSWTIEGNHEILGLKIQNHSITCGDYPDALARLYSTLHSHEGDFAVVSAKPGYQLLGESSPSHVGGASHGGFHKNDSLVPMIVTGTSISPDYLRMVDLKNWILRLTATLRKEEAVVEK